MRQVGAGEFTIAVVAIGTGIEASVLSTGVLIDLGVDEVWAKAITAPHGHILQRIGASHVVFPEAEVGERTAHMITGKLMGEDFTYAKPETIVHAGDRLIVAGRSEQEKFAATT